MKKLSSIVFWGALWGITEATIGHFLHIWTLPIGWLIWFPLAYGFMWTSYLQTGEPAGVLFSAFIAALIKFIDLFTTVRPDLVVNPAIAILLEGLAVFVVCKIGENLKKEQPVSFIKIMFASFMWRALFCVYLLFLPASFSKTPQISGFEPLAQFTLFESIMNSLLIYGVIKLFPKRNPGAGYYFSPHPAVSLGMLLIACFIQWRF